MDRLIVFIGGFQKDSRAAPAAGRALISSREIAYKVRNLRRDPRAALCVFVEAFHGPWVQIEGTAEVETLPEAMEPLGVH